MPDQNLLSPDGHQTKQNFTLHQMAKNRLFGIGLKFVLQCDLGMRNKKAQSVVIWVSVKGALDNNLSDLMVLFTAITEKVESVFAPL